MPIMLHPKSEAEWLELRKADVTSTESAALFGLSPYLTEFELWHRKRGQLDTAFEENERMVWGRRLEPVIAQAVAEEQGVKVRRLSAYMRHSDCPRMGASFDYEVVGLVEPWEGGFTALRELYSTLGAGVLEIKNVDFLIFRDQWGKTPEGEIEPPVHVDVQTQHQLEVVNRAWVAIALLVAGNDLNIVVAPRDEAVGAKLRTYIAAFWAGVDSNREPEPNFDRDLDVIKALHSKAQAGLVADLRGDNRIAELMTAYKESAALAKMGENGKDAAMAEIRHKIGDAETVLLPGGGKITVRDVAPTTVSYERKGYRDVRITLGKAA